MPEEDAESRAIRRRRLRASALCVVPMGLTILAIAMLGPRMWSENDRLFLAQWTMRFLDALLCSAAISFVSLLIWCCLPARGRPYGSVVAMTFLVCVITFFVGGMAARFDAPRTDGGREVVAANGAAYRTAFSGGRRSARTWIVRDTERRWWRDVDEIVAESEPNRGSSSGAPHMIRPSGDVDTGLRLDSGQRIYLVGDDGAVWIATDPAAPPRPPRPDGSESTLQRRAITATEISPFALLSHDVVGDDRDVAAIMKAIEVARDRGERKGDLWAPDERHLLAALDSTNPWIVETAKRFIRAGGPTLYPTASAKIGDK